MTNGAKDIVKGRADQASNPRRLTRLLPYRTFTIESPLELTVAEARLRNAIQPTRWYVSSPRTAPFEGVLDASRFDLQRVIQGRNSFLPVVRGEVESTPAGVRLVGTMRLHAVVIAFMTVWFGGVLVGCIAALKSIASGEGFKASQLAPLGFLAFGIALVLGGFLPETHKALRELASIVDATRAELR